MAGSLSAKESDVSLAYSSFGPQVPSPTDHPHLEHSCETKRETEGPAPLTAHPHAHPTRHGTAGDGRLFRNLTGGDLAESTIAGVWDKDPRAALTPEQYCSPLAGVPTTFGTPVSTWLGGGGPSTQVAEWAGHSVAVLHQIYAKVIAGQEESALRRIETALGLAAGPQIDHRSPDTAGDGERRPDRP